MDLGAEHGSQIGEELEVREGGQDLTKSITGMHDILKHSTQPMRLSIREASLLLWLKMSYSITVSHTPSSSRTVKVNFLRCHGVHLLVPNMQHVVHTQQGTSE